MATKNSRPMALFEAVMWGTSQQVQKVLDKRDLTFDDNWTDYALLITALRKKRKEVAKILLSKGCRIQKIPRVDASDTPLHYAIKMNEVEIVKILLCKGASVNDKNQTGETPLSFAMKKGSLEIVDLLLSANESDIVNTANNDGFSHFHIACIRNNLKLVKRFLENGAEINDCVNFSSKHCPGFTPLHFAVENKCLDMVKLLLSHNADITIKNAEDMTALHLAVEHWNDMIINLILSAHLGKNSNPTDGDGFSHFHAACMKNHLNAVEYFLQSGIDVNHAVNSNSRVWAGYTPLHFAIKGLSLNCQNRISIVELLLRYKANVNAKDAKGQTPLHLACLQSDEKISRLICEVFNKSKTEMEANDTDFSEKLSNFISEVQQTEVVKLLLRHKSDVNMQNIFKETPLFYLFKNDRSNIIDILKCDDNLFQVIRKELNRKRREILNILLEHNADVNIYNDQNQTILHLIASINKALDDDQKEDLVELIISKGANVNAQTKYGSTPLHMATKYGHPKLVELLLKHNANINALEGDQSTPLHLATSYQRVKVIDVLLKNKADVNATQCNKMNVLHLMALMNPESSEEVEFIESYGKIIKTFLEYGCEINAQDINGRTPLHLASCEHNNAATWAFLQNFADINIEDFCGETPLFFTYNDSDSCENILCMFKDYINMLKITGLPVNEKNDLRYTELYKKFEPDPKDDFLVQCKEEIEVMKNLKINNHCSIYDIIFKNVNEMVMYSGNDLFVKILNSDDFEKKFNIYGSLLKMQFRKGWTKKMLLEKAKNSLQFLIGSTLPDSCFERIFQYLEEKHLKHVVEAEILKKKNKITEEERHTDDESQSLEKAMAYCKNLFNTQMEMDIS